MFFRLSPDYIPSQTQSESAYPMITSTDRYPDLDETLPAPAKACRAGILTRKGTVAAPYGLLVHSPDVANAFDALSTALWQGDLPRRVTEGLFLWNARRHQCRYQWVRHVDKAVEAGLVIDVLDALKSGVEPPRDADLAFHAAWQLAETLAQSGPVDDTVFGGLKQVFSDRAIAELTAFCGFASIVSNTLRVRQPPVPSSERAPF
ncbi:carboxymuconolactone decarboxylase family protein [Pigmentiphaga litoralis]|uniref:carboxymuconolactone decarboxylase family protein n=1 Tax=Pigmentiphaga litoralis TaxID=516702 RepID=UPI003B431066